MSNKTSRLMDLKDEVDKAQDKRSRATGAVQAALDKIRGMGFKSPAMAKKEMDKLSAEALNLDDEINNLLEDTEREVFNAVEQAKNG